MIQIVTDSTADIPLELLEKYKIHVIPLKVSIDEKEYTEGVDITSQDFYKKMVASKNLPKTSQPTPAAFAQKFTELAEKGPVLCITISSKLSGSYQSACLGQKLSNQEATVFDSLGASIAHGQQVILAAELAEKGLSLKEIVSELTTFREKMSIFILVDTLENIVKGGRLNKFQGSLAKILNIKVLLEGIEGAVEMVEKVRGKNKFLQRVLEIMGERQDDFSNSIVSISHVDNLEDANFLKEKITELYHPARIMTVDMGPVVSTYAGYKGIILSFSKLPLK